MKFLYLLTTLSLATLTLSVEARPYPDSLGICYFFKGNDREKREPCVISTGYGAGGSYVVLRWQDGEETFIERVNFCPDRDIDEYGFCSYSVDGAKAEFYYLDVFGNPTTIEDSDNLPCYRVLETGNSMCFANTSQR